jgi:hypothetical protein
MYIIRNRHCLSYFIDADATIYLAIYLGKVSGLG